MKLSTKLIATSLAALLPLGSAIAASGKHEQGQVTIAANGAYMIGEFNVRYSPKPGHQRSWINAGESQVGATTSFNPAYFAGYDAVNNRTFYCRVNDYYMLRLARSAADGSQIAVFKTPGSNTCNNVTLNNVSTFQE